MEIEEPLEEVSQERLQEWYEEANSELKAADLNIELPRFPTHLRETETKYNSALGMRHAVGETFYPCCGGDTGTVLRLFGDFSERIVFADPLYRCSGRPKPSPTCHSISHVGSMKVNAKEPKPSCSGRGTRYFQDGVVTFCRHVENLAIFFYRGDSQGEGGSNQRWLAETLFLAVVSKLPHKGLIVTDGSTTELVPKDDLYGDYVPWNHFAGIEPFDPPDIGDSFTWSHIKMTYVAGPFEGGHGNRNTYAWQIENASKQSDAS